LTGVTDVDGDNVDITAVTRNGANGSESNVTTGDTCLTYTPDLNYNGPDTVIVSICDGNGGCDTVMIPITVTPVNDRPVAVDDSRTMLEDATDVTIPVQNNDSDVDGDALTTTIITAPVNGSAQVDTDGETVIYNPNANYNGLDSLVYTVCDAGGLCDTAVVNLTITPVNDPVDFPGSDTSLISTNEDVPISICFTDAVDVDGDPFDVEEIIRSGTNGAESNVGTGDRCFTYTPDPNYFGRDTVIVRICDEFGGCDTIFVPITVNPVNDPPVAEDVFLTTVEDEPVDSVLSGFISDIDDPDSLLTIEILTDSLPDDFVEGEFMYDSASRTFTFDPAPGFTGAVEFSYRVCDTSGICDTAMIFIDMTPSDSRPNVAEGFTPGDEGFWLIKNINEYPDNHVQVYNRYGHLVFETDGYINNVNAWDGRANLGIRFGGDFVPDGTYFYVIEYDDNGERKLIKGFLEVVN
jgi:gliding motility-associated-like protein